MNRIDKAAQCILDAETEYRGHPYDIRDDDLRRWLSALDAAGHLLPDLPEHDEIAHPGPIKVWDVGEDSFVEYDPRYDTISLSQLFGLEVRLDPDDIPTAVSALLAAHRERNQE